MLGYRKAVVNLRGVPRVVAVARDEYPIRLLLGIVRMFSLPQDILIAYLRRPIRAFSFRRGIEQLARGNFTPWQGLGGIADSEVVARATAVLRWLDGGEMSGRNPYEVLGLSASAGAKQIRSRYRALSKRVHPDHHTPGRQDYWCTRQNEVNEAYRILSDPELRVQWQDEFKQRKQLLQRLWEVETAARR